MLLFYINKGFYSRINFNFNIIDYVIIRKRLDVIKTQNIMDRMQNVFDYIREKLKKSQLIMIEQINRYKKKLHLRKTISSFSTLRISLLINYIRN